MSQFDLTAEKSVLGTVLVFPEMAAIAVNDLKPEYFHSSENQLIFKAITNLFFAGISPDTITVLNSVKKVDKNFQAFDLVAMQKGVINTIYFEGHCAILKDLYLLREATKSAYKLQAETENAKEPAKVILANHITEIYNLNHETVKDRSTPQILADLRKDRESRGGKRIAFKTGLESLDDTLFGLQPTDFTILAARPAQGKTAVALNIALNLIKQNLPVLFLSIEMSAEQLIERVEANMTGIDHERILNGTLNDFEKQKLAEAHEYLSQLPLYIVDESRITTTNLRAKVSMYVAKYGVKVVFIDYLQLMGAEGFKDDYGRIGEVSRTAKAISKEFKVSTVALAQLSREVEKRNDKMPQLSDLRESGQIEQDADRVLFIMRPEYYGMEVINVDGIDVPSAGKMIIKKAKDRHGAASKPIVLNWKGHLMRVEDIPTF